LAPSSTGWIRGLRIAPGELAHRLFVQVDPFATPLRDLHTCDPIKGVTKENVMRLLRNSIHGVLVLAAIAVALAPKAAFADRDRAVPITGTFTVATVSPSAVDYCASDTTPIEFRGGTPIEFRGIGNISKLGPLFLTVKKCAIVVGGVQTFAGTFTMTAGNGDTLNGTYAGTRVGSPENGGGQFQGTFTVKEGTGRFSNASGVLRWTAVTRPFTPTAYGAAFYLVEGNLSSHEKD
jgi:hypothetical protein